MCLSIKKNSTHFNTKFKIDSVFVLPCSFSFLLLFSSRFLKTQLKLFCPNFLNVYTTGIENNAKNFSARLTTLTSWISTISTIWPIWSVLSILFEFFFFLTLDLFLSPYKKDSLNFFHSGFYHFFIKQNINKFLNTCVFNNIFINSFFLFIFLTIYIN